LNIAPNSVRRSSAPDVDQHDLAGASHGVKHGVRGSRQTNGRLARPAGEKHDRVRQRGGRDGGNDGDMNRNLPPGSGGAIFRYQHGAAARF
jgi:hypothetical protein